MSEKKEERVIDRIGIFFEWCKKGKLVKNRNDFEELCGLSYNYIYNTAYNTKKGVGCEIIRKIHEAFPMMNITWMVTGRGSMITSVPDEGFREAYENLRKEVDNLKKIVSKM